MGAIKDYVDQLPPEFLWCRDVGHSWAEGSQVIIWEWAPRKRVWRLIRRMRCDICGSYSRQAMNPQTKVLEGPTRIEHTPGYCIPGGPGFRLTKEVRGAIRDASLKKSGIVPPKKPSKPKG